MLHNDFATLALALLAFELFEDAPISFGSAPLDPSAFSSAMALDGGSADATRTAINVASAFRDVSDAIDFIDALVK